MTYIFTFLSYHDCHTARQVNMQVNFLAPQTFVLADRLLALCHIFLPSFAGIGF